MRAKGTSPWPLPNFDIGRGSYLLATNPGRPSVMAAIDGANMAPDDDFYINGARATQESETYIKARRLA